MVLLLVLLEFCNAEGRLFFGFLTQVGVLGLGQEVAGGIPESFQGPVRCARFRV